MTLAPSPPTSVSSRSTPPAVLLVAAVVGIAVGVIGTGWRASLLIGPVLSVPAAVVCWHDLRERRIPNAVVVAAGGFAVMVAGTVEMLEHRDVGLSVATGAVVASAPLLAIHLALPASISFGDVKYAAAVGAALGVLDWRLAVPVLTAASIVGPVIAMVVPSWRRSIPLGGLLGVAATAAVAVQGSL